MADAYNVVQTLQAILVRKWSVLLNSESSFFVLFLSYSAGDGPQDLAYARQILYH